MDEVEIINLHKRCSKTGVKVETKRGAKAKTDLKAGSKASSKAPRSGYYLFLREQLEKMTGEERRNYRSIVSRRWREIKEDPGRLSEYNDRARQMKNETEKPIKAGDGLPVGSMEQQMVTEKPVVKRKQRQPKKAPKTPEFVDTDSDDSGNSDTKDTLRVLGFLTTGDIQRLYNLRAG